MINELEAYYEKWSRFNPFFIYMHIQIIYTAVEKVGEKPEDGNRVHANYYWICICMYVWWRTGACRRQLAAWKMISRTTLLYGMALYSYVDLNFLFPFRPSVGTRLYTLRLWCTAPLRAQLDHTAILIFN